MPVSLGYKVSAFFASQRANVSLPCRSSGTRFRPSRRYFPIGPGSGSRTRCPRDPLACCHSRASSAIAAISGPPMVRTRCRTPASGSSAASSRAVATSEGEIGRAGRRRIAAEDGHRKSAGNSLAHYLAAHLAGSAGHTDSSHAPRLPPGTLPGAVPGHEKAPGGRDGLPRGSEEEGFRRGGAGGRRPGCSRRAGPSRRASSRCRR
ncbi:hypothetical protein ACVWZ8_002653 [Arthrobacter sp. UYCu723]